MFAKKKKKVWKCKTKKKNTLGGLYYMSRLEFITHKKRLEFYAHFFWNISVYTKLMLVCSDLQRCIIAPWNSPKRQSLAKLHALHFTKNHKTSNDMWN